MKVANQNTIESGEKELLDTIIAELDWEVIEKKLKEKHNIKLQEDVEFSNGDFVVHGSKIAYKLNFDVKITLSVLFDRLGECIEISAAGSDDDEDDYDEENEENEESLMLDSDEEPAATEKNSELASSLAGMIDDINSDE